MNYHNFDVLRTFYRKASTATTSILTSSCTNHKSYLIL